MTQYFRALAKITPFVIGVRWDPREVEYDLWACVLYRNNTTKHLPDYDTIDPAITVAVRANTPNDVEEEILITQFPRSIEKIAVGITPGRPNRQLHSVKLFFGGHLDTHDPMCFELDSNDSPQHIVLAAFYNYRNHIEAEVINRTFPSRPVLQKDGSLR